MLLFVRPTNGVYLPPKVVRAEGKSTVEEIAVVQKDMPNFFVEAVTVAGGKVHDEAREIVVPPEKRVLNVEVVPSQTKYKPGQKATVKVKLTDLDGKPFVGSTVLTRLRQGRRVHLRRLERAGDQGVLLEVAAAPPARRPSRASTDWFGNLLKAERDRHGRSRGLRRAWSADSDAGSS